MVFRSGSINVMDEIRKCFVARESYAIRISIVLILGAGLWIAKQAGTAADLQMRRKMVRQVADVAAAVNPLNIRELSFTAKDKDRPEFQRVCGQMRAYAKFLRVNSLYTIAVRNDQMVFGPGNFPESQPSATSVGSGYKELVPLSLELFKTGKSQIYGPYRNESGMFVTAMAPVFNPSTGEVLVAVGFDLEASAWLAAVRRAQWIPAGIAMFLTGFLFLSGLILRHIRCRFPQRKTGVVQTETVLCFVFMSLLTVLATLYFHETERDFRRNTFQALARERAGVCAANIAEFGHIIDRLASFFESSDFINREEFSSYCRKIVQQGTIQGCVWIPAVSDGETDSLIQTVRTQGVSNFSIWQKNSAGNNEPATGRSVYYPALYIEPLAGYESGLGYDLNSELVRRAAIQEALRTELVTATDPVRLIAMTNQPTGIFIFKKVNASIQKGVVAFAVRSESLLGGSQFSGLKKNKSLGISLFELRQGEAPLHIIGTSSNCSQHCLSDSTEDLSLTIPIFQFGKAYILRLHPEPVWLVDNSLRHDWIVGLVGLLMTIMIIIIVALVTNRRFALEKLVKLRTAELKQMENSFRELTDSLSEAVFSIDSSGIVQYVNPAIQVILGYSLSEVIGKHFATFIHPDEIKQAEENFAKNLTGAQLMIDHRMLHRSGATIYARVSTCLVQNDQSDERLINGILMDITAQKEAEEKVFRASEEWQKTFDATNDAIWLLDENNRILRSNKMAEQFTGRSQSEMVGKYCWSFTHGTDCPIPGCPVVRAQSSLRRETQEWLNDGKWFELIADPLLDSSGGYIGSVHIISDITKRKEAEEELRQKMAALVKLNSFMVDRELRMIELKKEINELSQQAGGQERYKIVG